MHLHYTQYSRLPEDHLDRETRQAMDHTNEIHTFLTAVLRVEEELENSVFYGYLSE